MDHLGRSRFGTALDLEPPRLGSRERRRRRWRARRWRARRWWARRWRVRRWPHGGWTHGGWTHGWWTHGWRVRWPHGWPPYVRAELRRGPHGWAFPRRALPSSSERLLLRPRL